MKLDIEKNFLADNKILKCIAFGLRNDKGKDQELVGHPMGWKECWLGSQWGLAGTRFRDLAALSKPGRISSSVK